jgi:hypothetical protein
VLAANTALDNVGTPGAQAWLSELSTGIWSSRCVPIARQ